MKNLRSKRNAAHRKFKAEKTNTELKNKFINSRKIFEAALIQSKKTYYYDKFKSCIGNGRQTYKLLNELKGKSNERSKFPILTSTQKKFNKPTERDNANVFNEYFSNIGKKVSEHLDKTYEPNFPKNPYSMFLTKTDEKEIKEIINKLDDKSSSGYDSISNKIVKAVSASVTPYLVSLINLSIRKGVFPDELKKAKVLPLFKEGSKLEEGNYRPISLLIVWSKIYERVLHNRIYNFFEHFSLFHSKQFGFRSKHSTIDALVELTEKIRQNYTNCETTSFFIDLKKAFDTINHTLLLTKLERYGIRGNCLKWIQSYLENRKQKVELNGTSSSWLEITCGVPQGSILGPLLFLIYINDMPLVCKTVKVLLFADDTNIEAIGCCYADVSEDLKNLNRWLDQNKLVLNMTKTTQINFKNNSFKKKFSLCETEINIDVVCKYLGIKIDSKLSFKTHIDYVKKKISKQCGILAKLRHYVPREQLIRYYKTNIAPILQYGALVYCCCSFSNLNPLYILQKKALKTIYFRKRHESCEDIFSKHELLSIYELHIYELLKFVLKAINNLHSQTYCNNLYTKKSHQVTRKGGLMLLKEPLCKQRIKYHSIASRGARLYNKLKSIGIISPELDNATSEEVTNFCHKLKSSYLVNNNELVKFIFD